jgi:hypothetical protein
MGALSTVRIAAVQLDALPNLVIGDRLLWVPEEIILRGDPHGHDVLGQSTVAELQERFPEIANAKVTKSGSSPTRRPPSPRATGPARCACTRSSRLEELTSTGSMGLFA